MFILGTNWTFFKVDFFSVLKKTDVSSLDYFLIYLSVDQFTALPCPCVQLLQYWWSACQVIFNQFCIVLVQKCVVKCK